jgi:hypothetical protein
MTEISTDAEAEAHGFVGSPTILVDDEDVAPPREEPVGLNCRIYRRRDGTVSPTPDAETLREALQRARERATHEEMMR